MLTAMSLIFTVPVPDTKAQGAGCRVPNCARVRREDPFDSVAWKATLYGYHEGEAWDHMSGEWNG